jgi:hypothetical protein
MRLKPHVWVLAGFCIGLIFGLRGSCVDPADDASLRRCLSDSDFIDLVVNAQRAQSPQLNNLSIYPARHNEHYVTGVIVAGPVGHESWRPFFSFVRLPIHDPLADRGKVFTSIVSFANEKLPSTTRVEYRYLWWRSPLMVTLFSTAAGLVLIGGLMPLSLRLIFGKSTRPPLSISDLLRLMLAKYPFVDRARRPIRTCERMLRSKEPVPPPGATVAPALPLFNSVPIADAPHFTTAEELKEYDGEFYPVARGDPTNKKPVRTRSH